MTDSKNEQAMEEILGAKKRILYIQDLAKDLNMKKSEHRDLKRELARIPAKLQRAWDILKRSEKRSSASKEDSESKE